MAIVVLFLLGLMVDIVRPDIIDALAAFVGSALGPLCVMFAPTVAIERALRRALAQNEIAICEKSENISL